MPHSVFRPSGALAGILVVDIVAETGRAAKAVLASGICSAPEN